MIFRLKDIDNNNDNEANKKILKEIEEANEKFSESIYNDLNVSEALGIFFTLIKDINVSFNSINIETRDGTIKFIERVNNIINCFNMTGENKNSDIDEEAINKLIEERVAAKKEKNYSKADEIRNNLLSMGIEIMDTPQGVKWKRK